MQDKSLQPLRFLELHIFTKRLLLIMQCLPIYKNNQFTNSVEISKDLNWIFFFFVIMPLVCVNGKNQSSKVTNVSELGLFNSCNGS